MSYLNCDSTTAAIGSGPAPPMTSLGKLPKLMGRVVPSQALGFYQLYKASGNATQRDDTKEVFYQATSWNAPRYMDRPVNPAMEPFSRLPPHASPKWPQWSPADSVERLSAYTSVYSTNPFKEHSVWSAWEAWPVY